MKKYYLTVLYGHYQEKAFVEAEYFSTQTSSSTSSGYYAFYADKKLVACYPIERTIIYKIEEQTT